MPTTHRVKDILESLKNLPEPEYSGQVVMMVVMQSIEDAVIGPAKRSNIEKPLIPVVTERYSKDGRSWLEWTIQL